MNDIEVSAVYRYQSIAHERDGKTVELDRDVSPARASPDGTICGIDKPILRAAGVAATSPNEP